MSSLSHRNRITTQELTRLLRDLPFRPEQRRLIAQAFGRYGTEGITREEFEAGLHRLHTDRKTQYLLEPEEIDQVRQRFFPRARPYGKALPGERPTPRPTLPDRPKLRGLAR